MIASRNNILLSLAVVALFQTAVLAWMVAGRVRLLPPDARSLCRSCPSTRVISSGASTCGWATA